MNSEFIKLADLPGIAVDLRYATTDNFTGENLYAGHMDDAYLHRDAARLLAIAAKALLAERANWRLLILDALRPRSVQRKMWNIVKDTPQRIYVADPDRGSMHCFGLAVDLTLADASGRELDMGTPFDSFQELAQPRHEEKFLASGELKLEQVERRWILRRLMTDAGFQTIPHEWWHFNALPFEVAKAKYQMVE